MNRRSCLILTFLILSIIHYSFLLALPKDKPAGTSTANQPTAKPAPQKPAVRPNIIDYDDMVNINASAPAERLAAGYVNIGPQRPLYPSVNGVPYVNVRKGHTETPGGNNHMRRQVGLSPSGTVHLVYRIFDADSGEAPGRWGDTVYSPADSNTNGFFFYNTYDCGGFNSLLCDYTTQNGKCYDLVRPPDPPETRVSRIQGGGIFVQPGTNLPVVYGDRFIQRTDFGNGFYSRVGWATTKDSAECRGKFSMDTSYTASSFTPPSPSAPVMHPLDSSVWIATFRNGNFPEQIAFSYTTDAGVSWSTRQVLGTNSPWFNSTETASNGYDFYIVSMTDPNDPTAFMTTERPVCLKGTYNPGTQTVTFDTMQDITGDFELPNYLANFVGISALMIGDTLQVIWTDWNNYNNQGFPGPGGHVHHAAVWPDGTVEIHKIANINIDGRLPGRSTTPLGFMRGVWPNVSLSYSPSTGNLYALWSQPPPDSTDGEPNYQWADYEYYGTMACYDIFCSASPNNGRGWDDPQNVTQTNNPGCGRVFGNECAHEDWFSASEVADDTIWVGAMVQAYPGIQESWEGFYPGDPGPYTRSRDLFRLYKVPARAPVLSIRADLSPVPGDTIKLDSLWLRPKGGTTYITLRLSNVGTVDFYMDYIEFTGTLNSDGLVTGDQHEAFNYYAAGGSPGDFQIYFNTDGVGLENQGIHSGDLIAHFSTPDPRVPPDKRYNTLRLPIKVYVVQTLCFNRKIRIHSASNSTDIGSQGTIKDGGGNGMLYNYDGSDHFYDGGVLVANSALQAAAGVPGVPRKVTRQLYSDKFLRCVQDIVLDSTPGTGSYYNLSAVSVSTDVEDSSLLFKNIWEQSTHPDSSDFLLQTTQLWNISPRPIDSIAMGVIYDVDLLGGGSAAGENVGGDTSVTYAGREFWLGWISGNDVTIDTCSSNNGYYGVVVIPGSIGNPGDSVHPKGAVIFENSGFSYGIGNGELQGGDSLLQRYAWNLDVSISTQDRRYDTLTGVWQDTLGASAGFATICGGVSNPGTYRQTGLPYRTDIGYLAIAKKVNNYQPNSTLSALASRYGLQGAAASLATGIDSSFPGGEIYTVIHVVSVSGLTDLMNHAVKGIDWYVRHRNYQTGPYQISDDTTNQNYYEGRKGDLDFSNSMSPADAAAALSIVYAGVTKINGRLISLCVADMDNNGIVSPADFARVLNAVYVCNPAPCSNSPTALQECSH